MKVFDRKILFFMLAIAIAAGFAACSKTADTIGFDLDANGSALRGYDAVAYFAVNGAVKGDAKYQYVWNGAKWFFSSEENMNRFKADPEAFAPQFGGYCSYAVSEGYTANGDPEAWKVVDGKLYLNYRPKVKEMWEREQIDRIEKGNKNWQGFKTKKPEHKG